MSRTVGDLMAAAVVTADPGDTVRSVRNRMSDLHIGALPVVDAHGVLVGVVTADDLVAEVGATIPVSRVMTSPAETMPPSATAAEAARHMRDGRRHHVLVAEDDRLVGILSSFDLLALVESAS